MTNSGFKGATFSVDKSDVANQFLGHQNVAKNLEQLENALVKTSDANSEEGFAPE